jgi:hypothetical protein
MTNRPYDGDKMRPPDPDETQGDGPPLGSHFRLHNDWFEDPWAAPEVKERRRRERHKRWIAAISERDWARLAERAEKVAAGERFARFMDLDAPFDIQVAHPTHRMDAGERFGELKGCVLLAFPKSRRDR